jgi:hypothetical protein
MNELPLFIALIALAVSNVFGWLTALNNRKYLRKSWKREEDWKARFDQLSSAYDKLLNRNPPS